MKKGYFIGAVVVILLLAGGYLGRHKIKSLLAGAQTAATTISETPVETPSPSAAASATPEASAVPIVTQETGPKGPYLADDKGMTLYIFGQDQTNVSTCVQKCLTAWPPYRQINGAPMKLSAGVGTFKRMDDGTTQYTYKGMPLYYYAKDKKAGDRLGDGIEGINGKVWHIVTP